MISTVSFKKASFQTFASVEICVTSAFRLKLVVHRDLDSSCFLLIADGSTQGTSLLSHGTFSGSKDMLVDDEI